jgi:hypothetical protein
MMDENNQKARQNICRFDACLGANALFDCFRNPHYLSNPKRPTTQVIRVHLLKAWYGAKTKPRTKLHEQSILKTSIALAANRCLSVLMQPTAACQF